MASTEPALRVAGLRMTYPAPSRFLGGSRRGRRSPGAPKARTREAHEALRGVDLVVPAGQAVALLGPNGSGKSTLLKIISRTLPFDAGTVEVFGSTSAAAIRPAISVVFQSAGLDRYMTVMENLRDQAALYGLTGPEARQRIETELTRADLADRAGSLVKTLSSGLARRADLCRALLHRPRLLMLDEPTVGLDPVAREAFLRMLEDRRRDEGLTILMSTHLVDEADRADRVIVLHQGRIIADDSPENLRRRLGRRRVTILHGGDQPPAFGGLTWTRAAGSWSAPLPDDSHASSRLAGDLVASGASFTIAPPTLADVFEQLTGARLTEDQPS